MWVQQNFASMDMSKIHVAPPFTLLPPSTTSLMSSYHPTPPPPLSYGFLSPMSWYPSFFHWPSTDRLINVSLSHMQMPLEHDSLLISFCELQWIKNIQDALLAARLPASECIKYPRFHSTHMHTHNQPPSPHTYIAADAISGLHLCRMHQ